MKNETGSPHLLSSDRSSIRSGPCDGGDACDFQYSTSEKGHRGRCRTLHGRKIGHAVCGGICTLLSESDEPLRFIRENIDRMYQDEDGVNHCLLVLGEGCADGILVESEGSTYARYSAFVPNARRLLRQYDPALQSFCDRMQAAMEQIARTASMHQKNGMVRIPLATLASAPGEYPLDAALLSEMLSGQPEFQAVELFENEIVMQMDPKDTMAKQNQNDHADPVFSL